MGHKLTHKWKQKREREKKTFINDSIHTSLHNNQNSYLEAGMTQILKVSFT